MNTNSPKIETTVETFKVYPWWKNRWWLRSRDGRDPDGTQYFELYVPWWAFPLDFFHWLFLEATKSNPLTPDL